VARNQGFLSFFVSLSDGISFLISEGEINTGFGVSGGFGAFLAGDST
jgi:hypothetical protein